MPNPSSLAAATPRVEQELLDEYARQGWLVPLAVALSAVMVVSLGWDQAPRWLSLGWLVTVLVVLALRGWVGRWAARAKHVSLRRRLAATTVVSLMGGLAHGASVLFWPYLDELERAVQSTYVLGLTSGAVAAVVGYMPVFVAYMVPMLAPLSVRWVWTLATASGGEHRDAAAVIMLLFVIYAALLLVLARDTFKHYRSSFDSRQRMQTALEAAEAANRAKSRFLASASHDLRQPMHTLALFGAALGMMALDERARHMVSQMNLALNGLGAQLDSLLDISKLDAGVVPVNWSSVPLAPMLRQLGAELEPVAQRKSLRLSVDCGEDWVVQADVVHLGRVLRNLMDNAIKYTEAGEVSLTAHAEGEHVVVLISDSGLGIAADEHGRIFEEFYQVGNPERDRTQGLGLGLSIVRRLVDLMGIELSLKSLPGQGSHFALRLRRAEMATRATKPGQPMGHGLEGLRLLVVDDEAMVRDGMRAVLEGLGCTVSCAGTVAQAMEATRAHRPAAVLADLRLPGSESGIQAVQRLRTLYPGLPAMLISGDTAPERLREADAAGLRLLHKPVAAQALAQAIRELIQSPG